jgi:hypothetical protein
MPTISTLMQKGADHLAGWLKMRSRDLCLLAVNGTITVDFPLLNSSATHSGIGMILTR